MFFLLTIYDVCYIIKGVGYMSKRKENFKRIAENRTNKILNLINLLGNLSNKSYYEYTDQQINKIFDAIEEALITQKEKFNNKRKKFKL